MKLTIEYNIKLSAQEAKTLKYVLGKQSGTIYKDMGLTESEALSMSDLYDILPHSTDEN